MTASSSIDYSIIQDPLQRGEKEKRQFYHKNSDAQKENLACNFYHRYDYYTNTII